MRVDEGCDEDALFELFGSADQVEDGAKVAQLDFPLIAYIKSCIPILVHLLQP